MAPIRNIYRQAVMAIIITKNGKDAQKVQQQEIREESYLQRYISENPDAIPLDDFKEGVRLLVIGREFPTRSGPIDVLAVDRDGDLYIIETKRYKNPDKRQVVAQVLDYGASLWKGYGDADTFIRDLDEFIAESGKGGLAQQITQAYSLTEEDSAGVIAAIKRNLLDGNIKFLVLMDKLHEALRDLILFVNAKSRFDIYAVEMEFYAHGGLEIVIPRLFGAEVKKEVTDGRGADPRYLWDEQRFLQEAQQTLKAKEFAAVQRLCEFSKKVGAEMVWKNTASRTGGKCNVSIASFGSRRLYHFETDGTLLLDLQPVEAKDPGKPRRDRFKAALVSAGFPGVSKDEAGKVTIPVEGWIAKLPAMEEAIVKLVGEKTKVK